jgi:hypothetical protein
VFAQVSIVGRLDVNALEAAGQATILATPGDIGSVHDLFDDQAATLYRSANINPAQVTIVFGEAQAFHEFSVYCLAGANDWMVEAADTEEDLYAEGGSYARVVDWTTTAGDEWSTVTLPYPVTAAVVRLTVHRLTGDNYVHIAEWSLYGETAIEWIWISPWDALLLPGQSQQFTAWGETASSGSVDISELVTWSSLDPSVASIDSSGQATAIHEGLTWIRAELDSLESQVTLEVAADPTDLDVTFIERTPRYDYDAAKNNPEPGDPVVFTAHVRNWGGTALASVAYLWKLDGSPVASGTLTNVSPGGAERTVDLPWTWQAGDHTIGFQIDPHNLIAEASESNNALTDRVNGIIAGFWVEESLYHYFHTHQRDLNIGSNSWEDWIQRQMATQNALYASAVYSSSPGGVLDRVRIDKLIIVPDGALPLNGGIATNHPDMSDKTVDLMWGMPSYLLDGDFFKNTTSAELTNPFHVDQGMIHELGHARYLIDCYGFDVHNTYNPTTGEGHDSVQIYEGGSPVAGSELMPFIAWDSVLYYNISGGVMSGPYGFAWSPYEAAALNLIAGQRAVCGNYNAPCNLGVFLNDLPENNHLRFIDAEGRPLGGADVRIYQATGGPGWYGKTFDDTPDLYFTAGADGYVHLPRNPFSSGPIEHYLGNSTAVIILRVEHNFGVWYRFLEVSEFNMAYWSGRTTDAFYSRTLPDAIGCGPADFNCSGQVDQDDFDLFQQCATGPHLGPPSDGCEPADFDQDSDVDQSDFGVFQRCWSGTDLADAHCAS